MTFHFGVSRRPSEEVADEVQRGRGGWMYVPRAMYSLSRSFWMVPRELRHAAALATAT
jgi:hypothetical protein